MSKQSFVGAAALLAALLVFPVAGHAQDADTPPEQWFTRGDVNLDDSIGLGDAIDFLEWVFAAAEPGVDCVDAYDFDDSGTIGLADPIYLLTFLFAAGEAIPAPGVECGPDPTDDTLGCAAYSGCVSFPSNDPELVAHVLRRVGYGSTPALFDRVLEIGVGSYLLEQLEPDDIDESDNILLNTYLEDLDPDVDFLDLVRLPIVDGLYSRAQLRAVLADFWEQHFSTDLGVSFGLFLVLNDGTEAIYTVDEALEVATEVEHRENVAFRTDALGNFHDLLLTSATSVAMLIYLDNISNFVGNPNENYARELLELHTMGDDNGYTQQDIEELARVFTGWSICLVPEDEVGELDATCQPLSLDPAGDGNVWSFAFYPFNHDYGEKTLFEGTSYELILGDDEFGMDEGVAVLEHLATLPQTAEFVSTKLIQKFVADEAPPALIADCLATWAATDGDIREVMTTILTSDEFLVENRIAKVKTPLEFVLSTIRAFDGETDADLFSPLGTLDLLGALPFFFATPDGFPEGGDDQLGTHTLREEIEFAKSLYNGFDGVDFTNLRTLMEEDDVDLGDAEEVVTYWMDRTMPGAYSLVERQLAIDFLETDLEGNPLPLNPDAFFYELQIQLLCSFLATYPQMIQQ